MTQQAVRQIVLASRPKGRPTLENFRLEDAAIPELPPGGVLLRVLGRDRQVDIDDEQLARNIEVADAKGFGYRVLTG